MNLHRSSQLFSLAGIIILTILFSGITLAQDKGAGPKYNKILVLAKIEQNDLKKSLEDQMVAALKKEGYNAIASYSNFSADDLSSVDKLIARADTLNVDALVAFVGLGVETTVKNSPTVSASVGVPVRIGFMSVFVGGSVPLGGGPQQQKIVNLKAGFYTDRDPRWTMNLSGNLDKGTDALIYDVVKKTKKGLFKDKVL